MGSFRAYEGTCVDKALDFGGATQERLTHLRSSVGQNGQSATFELHCTNMKPFIIDIPFAQFGSVWEEVHNASNLMLHRRGGGLERDHERLYELCSEALTPRRQVIIVDPYSADHIYILQFDDHEPLAIRMSALAVADCQVKTIMARHNAAH